MKLSKEMKAGLIAVFAIVTFVFLFQFMKGRNVFSTDDAYYTKYNDVQGLDKSAAITINGLKVGQVDNIMPILKNNGQYHFVVKFFVKEGFKFSKNSTLEIFEPSLMADKEIKINLGSGSNFAKAGDTLQGTIESSITSQIAPVKDQLQSVLKRIDSLTNNANKLVNEQNRAQIQALLSNLNRTVTSFENTSKQTNNLLSNTDPKVQKILDNANLATISAKNAVDKYGKVADNIDTQKLNSAVDKLSITADKLNNVISGIENGQGSLGKLTKDDELYKNLNHSAENLNSLIEDLKTNPKRYLNFSVFGKNSQ